VTRRSRLLLAAVALAGVPVMAGIGATLGGVLLPLAWLVACSRPVEGEDK